MKKKQDMRALGSLGGKANVAKNGTKHMKELAKKANEKRWGGDNSIDL
jgi:hypothetical protein